jgi:S-DNA-T family DNA segregation ATPase FtsK/SpoIIIE
MVRRGERRKAPEMPRGEILLEPPPELPEVVSDGFQQMLMVLPMLAMGGGMAFAMLGPGAHMAQFLGGGAMALGMGGMMFTQVGRGKGDRKNRLNNARRDYMRYLGQVRRKVRRAASQQREALEWSGPEPSSLWSMVMSARLWERRPSDSDFGHVRIGTGQQRLAVQLITPETKPVEDLDPLCAGALRRFVRTHGNIPDLPVAISLPSFARVIPTGEPEAVYGLVRAMIAQLATFHSPDEVRISVCASAERMRWWQWIKWLPHNLHPSEQDAAGPVRLMHQRLRELETILGPEIKDRSRFSPGISSNDLPYHVVIVDGGEASFESQIAADGVHGVAVIDLTGKIAPTSDATMLRLKVTKEQVDLLTKDRTGKDVATRIGKPDSFALAQADALARQLAPLRPGAATGPGEDALEANLTLTSLLGIENPYAIDTAALWRPRAQRHRLRVPIGVDAEAQPVELDIKESAQGGMGPHGLVIGATGSGKSELLRTLVLGLALSQSSEVLNFVLVDFKGGATFLGLDRLSHVSAVITNLEDELPLVDRMYDAVHGEMVRRQELLRAAGNYASLRDYERDRERGANLTPMPTLFVVLDEFSELLSAKPDFIDLFVMIGRLGRSLGVHLLLASQRLEEGKLRGLDTHLSYRVGLRTFSAMESRVVLGVPDAYELPSQPGNGYLKFDTTGMTRFKAAYVSGPVAGDAKTVEQRARVRHQIVPYSASYITPQIIKDPAAEPQPEGDAESKHGKEGAESLLDILVRQLRDQGPPAHRIWLPPLDVPPTLDELLPELSTTPQYGLTAAGWEWRGRLHAVAGIIDRPFDQRRDPMWLDLSGAAGHVAAVGAPQSGKSTLLRSLVGSLALLHTPEEAQFYFLDFGGGTLASLAGLPHVGGVATRLAADRVRRTVAEVTTLLEQRERLFAEQGIDTIATYRRMRASGEISGDGFGDVFLVVDGWLTIRQEYEALEGAITTLAARGLGFGIHVIATTNKWSEFRTSIRDLFGTRLELRLGDPYESEINRRLAANVPENSPGRGLTREGLHFLTALPRIDGRPTTDDLADGVKKSVDSVATAWQGKRATQVRLLPDIFPAASLPPLAETGTRVPFGIDEDTLSPVYIDFSADPHFLIFGDTECGKSNLLRLISEGIAARHTPEEARLIFIDYRRSLLDSAGIEHNIGYAAAGAAAAPLLNDVREALTERLPPADLTPDQLRSRSWWSGSDLFLIVDDYDLVATSANPLTPIVELLPQARDIGLHVVLVRASGGAGRSMFDPVIQRIREMGSPGLVMSGSKDEGTLLGSVKAQQLPPGRGYLVARRSGTKLVQTALLGG